MDWTNVEEGLPEEGIPLYVRTAKPVSLYKVRTFIAKRINNQWNVEGMGSFSFEWAPDWSYLKDYPPSYWKNKSPTEYLKYKEQHHDVE
jgi:hypothetical protein